MTTKDISQAKDPAMRGSMSAMRRAARQAREVAIRTNTAIVVKRHGKTVRVTADELRHEQMEAEASGRTDRTSGQAM